MSRRSQTEMAVLGALSMQSMTAYALREAIRDVLGHFWSESFGQIYPTLNALEDEGLVQRRDAARRHSSTFTITPRGQDRLRNLLAEPITGTPPRNGLLLRLFFGRLLGPDACRALLQAAADQARERLQAYDTVIDRIRTEDADSPDLPYQLLTLSAGRHSSLATIAWVGEALQALEAIQDTSATGPAPVEQKEPQ